MTRYLLLIALSLLAACSLPRGGPLQNEVLRAQQNADKPKDYAVYNVDKSLLPVIAGWPLTGPYRPRGWIAHRGSGGDTLIRPGDLINVTIWDSQDNSLLTPATEKLVNLEGIEVSAGGLIFLPYLGRVQVAGRTAESARLLIQRRLEDIVAAAQVQLSVIEGQQSSVSLVSGVAKPGTYPIMSRNYTLMELIAAGGGISPDLRNPQVNLVRDRNTYQISARKLYASPQFDTVLHGGDKVVVTRDERYFRALGAALTESLVYFEGDQVTALDALSMMGGLADSRANPKGILVLRDYNPKHAGPGRKGPTHARVVFVIDLTTADGLFSAGKFRINPGDTVLVTESIVSVAATILQIVGLSRRTVN